MSNKSMQSKQQYLEAQNQLLDEALQGNLCQIRVYPSQNRELWLIDDTYKTIGLIHRWLFFSAYLKSDQLPEERVFSVYTFASLLKKAVYQKGARHPQKDFVEFAEEALRVMASRNIVELLRMENGEWRMDGLLSALNPANREPKKIKKGRQRYKNEEEAINDTISYLDRCWKKNL